MPSVSAFICNYFFLLEKYNVLVETCAFDTVVAIRLINLNQTLTVSLALV